MCVCVGGGGGSVNVGEECAMCVWGGGGGGSVCERDYTFTLVSVTLTSFQGHMDDKNVEVQPTGLGHSNLIKLTFCMVDACKKATDKILVTSSD